MSNWFGEQVDAGEFGRRAREIFDGLVRRVEVLETRLNPEGLEADIKWATGVDRRLHALETQANSSAYELVEAKRRDRWHATYNAALQGLLGFSGTYSWEELEIHRLDAAAAAIANHCHGIMVRTGALAGVNLEDLAHGPLEKRRVGESFAHDLTREHGGTTFPHGRAHDLTGVPIPTVDLVGKRLEKP